MAMTLRGLLTLLHGMVFGLFFLLAAYGALAALCRSMLFRETPGLTQAALRWERAYLTLMAALGWAAVASGTYLVYPWYRAAPPPGTINLNLYPQHLLLSNPATAAWHSFGMEWKEHIAWMAPMLLTAAAYVWTKYGGVLEEYRQVRAVVGLFVLTALFAGGIAAGLGALINKAAPVRGGSVISVLRAAQ